MGVNLHLTLPSFLLEDPPPPRKFSPSILTTSMNLEKFSSICREEGCRISRFSPQDLCIIYFGRIWIDLIPKEHLLFLSEDEVRARLDEKIGARLFQIVSDMVE